MKTFQKYASLALMVVTIGGCASQGSITHDAFEDEQANYKVLDLSLHDLYLNVDNYSGTFGIDQNAEAKALRALRHLAKWSEDPGKRAMAARGLVLFSAFAGDGDLVEGADDRAAWLLTNGEVAVALSVIEAKRDIVLGRAGIWKGDLSINAQKPASFEMASDSARKDALNFLIDNFVEVDEYLQYQIAMAFGQISSQAPNCSLKGYKMVTREVKRKIANPALKHLAPGQPAPAGVPSEIETTSILTEEDPTQMTCRKDDQAILDKLKLRLVDKTDWMIGYGDLQPHVASAVLMAAADVEIKDRSAASKLMADWPGQGLFAKARLPILTGAINKGRDYYPDLYKGTFEKKEATEIKEDKLLVDANQPATAIAQRLKDAQKNQKDSVQETAGAVFAANTNYANLSSDLGPGFWLNNAEMILKRQLQTGSDRLASGPLPADTKGFKVPKSWVLNPSYDGSKPMMELQSILYYYSIKMLRQGYEIDNPRGLPEAFKARLDALAGAKSWERERLLSLIRVSYPSMAGADLKEVRTALLEGWENQRNELYLRQLYMLTLVDSLQTFPKEEAEICKSLEKADVQTRWAAAEQVKGFRPKPKVVKDSVLEGPKLCGIDLYGEETPKPTLVQPVTPEAPAVAPEPKVTTPTEQPTTEIKEETKG